MKRKKEIKKEKEVNNKMKANNGRVIAWIFLIILIVCLLGLNYFKFFGTKNPNIEEKPVENSSSEAIQIALTEIVDNFNRNGMIQEYSKQEIDIRAVVNNHSIFISHTTDTTITYEFSYNNLMLAVKIENEPKNIEKFKQIYKILILAVQKRIGNIDNIDSIINKIINENKEYPGFTRTESDNTIEYKINITKKLQETDITQ